MAKRGRPTLSDNELISFVQYYYPDVDYLSSKKVKAIRDFQTVDIPARAIAFSFYDMEIDDEGKILRGTERNFSHRYYRRSCGIVKGVDEIDDQVIVSNMKDCGAEKAFIIKSGSAYIFDTGDVLLDR